MKEEKRKSVELSPPPKTGTGAPISMRSPIYKKNSKNVTSEEDSAHGFPAVDPGGPVRYRKHRYSKKKALKKAILLLPVLLVLIAFAVFPKETDLVLHKIHNVYSMVVRKIPFLSPDEDIINHLDTRRKLGDSRASFGSPMSPDRVKTMPLSDLPCNLTLNEFVRRKENTPPTGADYLAVGGCYLMNDEPLKAVGFLRKAQSLTPEDEFRLRTLLLLAYRELGQEQQIAAVGNGCRRLSPSVDCIVAFLARSLTATGRESDFQSALTVARRFAAFGSAVVWYAGAKVALSSRNPRLAMERFQKSFEYLDGADGAWMTEIFESHAYSALLAKDMSMVGKYRDEIIENGASPASSAVMKAELYQQIASNNYKGKLLKIIRMRSQPGLLADWTFVRTVSEYSIQVGFGDKVTGFLRSGYELMDKRYRASKPALGNYLIWQMRAHITTGDYKAMTNLFQKVKGVQTIAPAAMHLLAAFYYRHANGRKDLFAKSRDIFAKAYKNMPNWQSLYGLGLARSALSETSAVDQVIGAYKAKYASHPEAKYWFFLLRNTHALSKKSYGTVVTNMGAFLGKFPDSKSAYTILIRALNARGNSEEIAKAMAEVKAKNLIGDRWDLAETKSDPMGPFAVRL